MYCCRYSLLTPRNGRMKFRRPVQMPSMVLQSTSRVPSPSSSRAHSRSPGVWHTLAWARPLSGKWLYACHSSVYTVAVACVRSSTKGWRVSRSLWWQTSKRISPLSRPTTPATGGRSLSQVPWPFTLLARRRGGSSGSSCLTPFSPAFWYISSASVTVSFKTVGGEMLLNQLLNLVTVLQQVRSVDPELARQVLCGHALRHPTQNQNNRGAAVARPVPDRVRKQIVDCATRLTPIVQDWRAMPIMCPLTRCERMPLRTVQALRVQHRDEVTVAGLLVHQRLDRKRDHTRPSSYAARQLPTALEDTRFGLGVPLCTPKAKGAEMKKKRRGGAVDFIDGPPHSLLSSHSVV